MPESIVAVTEGAGKKLHTWQRTIGANTVEDEIVILGEQMLASYWTISYSASTATSAAHLIQVMAGASLVVRVRRITLRQKTAAGTAAIGEFDIVRLTTAGTGGGVLGVNKLDTSDGAAGATAMSLPTVKGTEGTGAGYLSLLMTGAATTAGNRDGQAEWVAAPGSKGIVIPAGTTNGIAVKNNNAIASGTISVIVEFVETSFL